MPDTPTRIFLSPACASIMGCVRRKVRREQYLSARRGRKAVRRWRREYERTEAQYEKETAGI